ncbi:MAG: Dam family site-specific DNA-(adenine-N6)-methyltransferase [Bacteroidales bacterium]|nr:Dam family site-specific DNA-(adenine-N6)-methyltransferase [Bacteroidales bacterium]MCF8338142.1 Dam family site-specific DNA-(adenine-N6)-methyltransferase [Bacteroidales bacterium]
MLPKAIQKIKVPPVKCQGIKTKLVPFISESIKWEGVGKWIEPFLGSGVVAFNIQPKRALLADTNKYIIQLYKDIQSGKIDSQIVREYLLENGELLRKKGDDYYYQKRKEFNEKGGTLDFLFLNRASFNGLMRFNSKGIYNVPFGKKPERFRKAYITKIANQIGWIQSLLSITDWEFMVADYEKTLSNAKENDFVYLDPPYIGRSTDYFNDWKEDDAIRLAEITHCLPCGFALSMWKQNKYRENEHLKSHWNGHTIKTFSHFYHVGSNEDLRNAMTEALVIKTGFENTDFSFNQKVIPKLESYQINLDL